MFSGYITEVDKVSKDDWDDVVQSFDDGNIFQSWSWGSVRWGKKSLSHLVLRKDGVTVAAAQAWIIKVPLLERGIAYVKWGPMWLREHDELRLSHYRCMLRSLREEYCRRRGLLLRIMPNVAADRADEVSSILSEEGFELSKNSAPYRTLVVDLSHTMADLKDGLKRQWRQCLNKAELKGLVVKCGTGEALFDVVERLYREMHARKGFAEFMDIDEMRSVNNALPDRMKMNIFVCEAHGNPVSACLLSRIGNTAIGMMAATGGDGLILNSSHLIQWRIVEWLKSSGCRWYDLGGIEPKNYSGTYLFKVGLSGKQGRDILFNDFDYSNGNSGSRIAVRTGDHLRQAHRKFKEWAARYRHA